MEYKKINYVIYQTPETGHFCAYVQVPDDHFWVNYLKKKTYQILPYSGKRITRRQYGLISVQCHGGLTYGTHLLKPNKRLPKGWWIGWDYAHPGDFLTLVDKEGNVSIPDPDGKIWDKSEVEEDCKAVIDQLIQNWV